MKKLWLYEMTWEEIADAIREPSIVLVPLGSTEQHGRHLPEGTDTMVAIKVALDVAKEIGGIVAPPLWFGWSPHHMPYAGTISLRSEVLVDVVVDICRSLAQHGFRTIILVNGHRIANLPPLQLAAAKVTEENGTRIVLVDPAFMAKTVANRLGLGDIGHGDELETSHMLYIHPELIKMDHASRNVPPPKRMYRVDPRYEGDTSVYVPSTAAEMDKLRMISGGVVGDPTRASAEKGKQLHEGLVENIVAMIKELES